MRMSDAPSQRPRHCWARTATIIAIDRTSLPVTGFDPVYGRARRRGKFGSRLRATPDAFGLAHAPAERAASTAHTAALGPSISPGTRVDAWRLAAAGMAVAYEAPRRPAPRPISSKNP